VEAGHGAGFAVGRERKEAVLFEKKNQKTFGY
jgi:hypothetical protein